MPSKGETNITFSDALGLPSMTFGEVTFTPSDTSCSAASAAKKSYASPIISMLRQDSITDFTILSWVVKEYVNKKHEMIAMGCPAELVNENEDKIIEGTRAYFDKHHMGDNSVMADKHFSAALDKIMSVQNPREKDFVEVTALMRFGVCPEAKEAQASADSLTRLVDEVEESEEEELVEMLQTCFATENCAAIKTELPETSSLMQRPNDNVAFSILFVALLILCAIAWEVVLFVLFCWLVATVLIQ